MCCEFDRYLTTSSMQIEKENDRQQKVICKIITWIIIQKRRHFECKNAADCDIKPYCLLSPNSVWGWSHRPQLASLAEPTRPRPLDKVSMLIDHITDSPPRLILQLLPARENSVQGHKCSTSIRKTCPNHLNLFWLGVCSEDWTLGPST